MSQNKLKKIAKEFASRIINANKNKNYFTDPYQHIVLDDVFETEFADAISQSFPLLTIHLGSTQMIRGSRLNQDLIGLRF